ncbi:MAG: matrixin family metalloprotease [Planctomycetaceae bacterium]|nr:matrixin family metalloprotease [Planctomycetaceae bacterium]
MSDVALSPTNESKLPLFHHSNVGALSNSPEFDAKNPPAFPWLSPDRLTVSFAPDGTRISNYSSNLFTAFASTIATSEIESTILRAFQQWSREASINVGYRSDQGEPFGISGPTQGDLRFGDIRIGAIPMASDTLAVTVRHDPAVSGSWAGDILFNSKAAFRNVNELYSVALHEIGHALGLSHSTAATSVMNPRSINSRLSAQDINNLRAIYGNRALDPFDQLGESNDQWDQATRIRNAGSVRGRVPLIVYGDLHSATDVDYFELPPLSNYSGPIEFELITAGISLARVNLRVYREDGSEVGSEVTTDFRGGRVMIRIASATDGESYFARVSSAEDSEFSIGSYALKTVLSANNTADSELTERVVTGKFWQLKQQEVQNIFLQPNNYFFNEELSINDTFATSERMKDRIGYTRGSHFEIYGSFSYTNDRDVYLFQAPRDISRKSAMTLQLTTLERSRLVTRLEIYDSQQVAVPHEVIVNGNGLLTIQLRGVVAKQNYYVVALSDRAGDRFAQGNYYLAVRFDQPMQALDILASGTLSNTSPQTKQKQHALYVAETQMFHLSLAALSPTPPELAQVWVTIFDPRGNPVYRVLSVPGQTRSAQSVVLSPGSYTILTSLATSTDSLFASIDYVLKGVDVTDPIGPELIDPSKKPFKKIDGTTYVYPGNRLSPNTYLVVEGAPGITPDQLLSPPPTVDANAWYWYENWLTKRVPIM